MFSWRQTVIGIFFFVLVSFLLVPHIQNVMAVGCNGDCSVYGCDGGLSCISNVCKPPYPSCSGAAPQSAFTNSTSGNFYTWATGVANTTSITFPTWSDYNNQDDLENPWYPGTYIGTNNWRGTINLGAHSANAGPITTHVYLSNCGYTNVWCGTANFTIDSSAPTCTVSGPTAVCRGTSVTYSMVGSDPYYTKGQIYREPAGTQSWANICDPASGNCSGSTTFSLAGSYDVVCNAYDSGGNKCTGNPVIPPGSSDCGAGDALIVTVSDPPAEQNCPTYCGYPGGTVPSGTCGGTKLCAAVLDTTAPPVPSLSSTTANCSGGMSFSWPGVSDVGCYGNVDYWLQVDDGTGIWPYNGWGATSSFAIASPVVGRVYKAQIKSSDNGASHTNQSAWSAGALWTAGVPYCCKTTAAALAPLSPSGTCDGSTFPATYTWTADPNASGYYLNITGCVTNQWIAGGASNSYTLTGAQQAACASSIATGSVPWSIQATYAGGCSSSAAASASFNYDKTAPPVPVPTIQLSADAACLGKYKVVHSWSAVSDVGCSGLNTNPYWSQISTGIAFPDNNFPINGWGSYTTQTSTSYVPATTVYTHVQSRDALNNQSGWSGPETVVIPVPSPYPTIHIAGTINEDIDGTCKPMNLVNPLTLSLSFVPSIGVSYTCTAPAGSATYACNITINNQTGLCVNPTTTASLAISGSYSGYDSVDWRAGDVCGGSQKTAPLDVAAPLPSAPIYLTYNSGNPGGWFKLKDTSFDSRQSGRQNTVPNNMKAYDTEDTDTGYKTLSVNSGLVVQNGLLQPGENALNVNGKPIYSQNNWYTDSYNHTNDISYQKYIDYIKARKDFKIITALSEITGDGIYSISSPVTLTASQFDGKKVVLVVQGASATFSTNFIPTAGSVAVLAKNIIIDPSVTEIDAILIGQTVTTGVSANGLKIKGNLINESALSVERTQNDGRMPALFVVFDPQAYLNVLPYLSTSTYDWRQIQ